MSGVWDELARTQQGLHDPPGSLPDRVHARLRGKVMAWAGGLPPGSRVLDLGCGRGALANGLARRRPDLEVIGMDVSQGMLDLAAGLAPDRRNPVWLRSEGPNWPLADRSVDAVVVMDLLANLDLEAEALPLLAEARRVCRRWLLLEIKTPWVLRLILRLRASRLLSAAGAAYGLGSTDLDGRIPVHAHDPAALLGPGAPAGRLRPWPLLPAPSQIFVLDLGEASE